MIVKNKCINCANSYSGYAESSMHYSLRCELDDIAVSENGTCESFKLNDYPKLKFQIEKNIELQSKLDKAVEALKYFDEVHRKNYAIDFNDLEAKAFETLKELGVE